MTRAYFQLRKRVDRHVESVFARCDDQIACKPGCADCCEGGLTLVMVEAVVLGGELGLPPERVHLQAGQPPLRKDGPCALLDEQDRCLAYPARPIICRSHGVPLLYPDAEDPVGCPLNFVGRRPHSSAVLDMEKLETALFAVNLDYCRRIGLHPLSRVAIDRLAALPGMAR